MSYMLPHLENGWQVREIDSLILKRQKNLQI